MNRYVRTPDIVSYNEVVNSQYKLSSSLFLKLVIPNANSKKLAYFLSRKLDRTDLGVEVGSLSYIDKSSKYFLRTKALQDYSYILELNSETMLPILPKDFVNMHLKKGDVVISKDSNIGEVVILEKDYPDCMLSGALYKLPIKEEWKYYGIFIWTTNKKYWADMFVGVSWYEVPNRKNKISKKDRKNCKLNCLNSFDPNDEEWPYGWEFLQNDICNWNIEIIDKIVQGKVFDYIKQKFEEILAEIDERGLRMP